MNINDALLIISQSKTLFGVDESGNIELIKHSVNCHSTPDLSTVDNCIDFLWDMFEQKTNIKFFDESFKKDFYNLISKHSKRMGYET